MKTPFIRKNIGFRRHWPLAAIGLFVFLIHLVYTSQLPFSGKDDGLVYYHVAQQIVQGEGITIPYIWNFLASPESLTSPAFGYWMPLASFVTVPGLQIFGVNSVVGALIPQGLFVVALMSISYGISLQFTGNRLLANATALIVAFHPWTVERMVSSESALPTAVAGSLAYVAIALAISTKTNRARWLAAGSGIFAGLANLGRGDGVLILVIIIATLIVLIAMPAAWKFSHGLRGRHGLVLLVLVSVGFLLVMGPWYMRNSEVFGSYTPPGSKSILATNYEDIYSLGGPLTISNYLDRSLADQLRRRALKVGAWARQILPAIALLLPFIAIGIMSTWFRWPIILIFGFAHLVVVASFYIVIAPELCCRPDRAVLTALPILGAGFALGLHELRRSHQAAVASMIVGLLLFSAVIIARDNLRMSGEIDDLYSWVGEVVREDARANDIANPILMSRKPWRVFEIAKLRTLQIPREDTQTIVEVAERFGATYLHLIHKKTRAALTPVYNDADIDDNFTLIAQREDHKIFRLSP